MYPLIADVVLIAKIDANLLEILESSAIRVGIEQPALSLVGGVVQSIAVDNALPTFARLAV